MKASEKAKTLTEATKIGNRQRAIHIAVMSVILYTLVLLPFQLAFCKGFLMLDNYLYARDHLSQVIGDSALASEHVDLNKI